MSFFNNLFGSEQSKSEEEMDQKLNWIPITQLNQIEEIKKESEITTVFIFKHSTRCGISRMVIKQFEKLFSQNYNDHKVYYLDLLNYRTISDEIGYSFQVTHESPQLLIIRNAVAIFSASHYDILETDFPRFV